MDGIGNVSCCRFTIFDSLLAAINDGVEGSLTTILLAQSENRAKSPPAAIMARLPAPVEGKKRPLSMRPLHSSLMVSIRLLLLDQSSPSKAPL